MQWNLCGNEGAGRELPLLWAPQPRKEKAASVIDAVHLVGTANHPHIGLGGHPHYRTNILSFSTSDASRSTCTT